MKCSTLILSAMLLALPAAAQAQYSSYPDFNARAQFEEQKNQEQRLRYLEQQQRDAEYQAMGQREQDRFDQRMRDGAAALSGPTFVPYDSRLSPGITPYGTSRY